MAERKPEGMRRSPQTKPQLVVLCGCITRFFPELDISCEINKEILCYFLIKPFAPHLQKPVMRAGLRDLEPVMIENPPIHVSVDGSDPLQKEGLKIISHIVDRVAVTKTQDTLFVESVIGENIDIEVNVDHFQVVSGPKDLSVHSTAKRELNFMAVNGRSDHGNHRTHPTDVLVVLENTCETD